MLRMLLLALPQGWVVYTTLRFHETVLDLLGAALSTLRFELLGEAVVVLVFGWLVLAADLLIASVLFKLALSVGAREGTGNATTSSPSTSRWPNRPSSPTELRVWPLQGIALPFGRSETGPAVAEAGPMTASKPTPPWMRKR